MIDQQIEPEVIIPATLPEHPLFALIDRLEEGTERLSFSAFNAFCKSPRHFIEYKLRQVKETKAMLEGTVLHKAVLDPDSFDEQFTAQDVPGPTSTNQARFAELYLGGVDAVSAYQSSYVCKGKSDVKIEEEANKLVESLMPYFQFMAQVGERRIITKAMFDFAQRASERLWQNDASRYVLEGMGETEKKVRYEYGGFKWAGFIDGIGDDLRMDLKLMADASERKARRTIEDSRYHWQVGNFYSLPEGCGGNRKAFIVCIDRGLHISVHEIRPAVVDQQWSEIRQRWTAFKRCIAFGDWAKSYDFWAPNGIYTI